MTVEEFEYIIESAGNDHVEINGDNVFFGLQIISKYTNEVVISADHDQIWSALVLDLIGAGIAIDDVIKLGEYNWFIDEETDSLSSFI